MKKTAESAAKWLADKVKANPKLNPIPYPFFKSIINKQIEWAAKRGVALDFTELAEAVRSELLKAGIYTMADSKPQHQPAKLSHEDIYQQDTGGVIPPLFIQFSSASEAMCAITIFDWLHKVFSKAHAEKYSGLRLTASGTQEVHHA